MITVVHKRGYPKVARIRRGLSAILFIFSPIVFLLSFLIFSFINPPAAYAAPAAFYQTDDTATARGFQYPGYAVSNTGISGAGDATSVNLTMSFFDGFES